MATGGTYYPKCVAEFTIPLFGTTAEKAQQAHGTMTNKIVVVPVSVSIEVNSHLQADSCTIVLDVTDGGFDPRLVRGGTAEVYIWNNKDPAGDRDPLLGGPPLFVGIIDRVERHGGEGHEGAVTIKLLDYTTLFLHNKHFPTAGVPSYEDTLPEIWRKICDHTGFLDVATNKIVSNVEVLRDAIQIDGFDPNRKIGESVTHRIRKFGSFPVREGDSAWDIWLRACQMLSLITWIDRDKVFVAPTTEHFKSGQGPRLILGDNIYEWGETIDSSIADKGVYVASLDTVSGKLLETFYPPPGDPRIHVKRSTAKKKKFDPTEPLSDHYEPYEYHDITDQKALDAIAQRVYAEQCRQEIQGRIKTGEFSVADGAGNPFDLLSLRAGDIVRVELSPEYEELLRSKGDTSSRIKHLTDRGFDDLTAELISKNVDALPNLKPEYHVKQLNIVLDCSSDPGRFEIEIYYHNKIQIFGDSDDSP